MATERSRFGNGICTKSQFNTATKLKFRYICLFWILLKIPLNHKFWFWCGDFVFFRGIFVFSMGDFNKSVSFWVVTLQYISINYLSNISKNLLKNLGACPLSEPRKILNSEKKNSLNQNYRNPPLIVPWVIKYKSSGCSSLIPWFYISMVHGFILELDP